MSACSVWATPFACGTTCAGRMVESKSTGMVSFIAGPRSEDSRMAARRGRNQRQDLCTTEPRRHGEKQKMEPQRSSGSRRNPFIFSLLRVSAPPWCKDLVFGCSFEEHYHPPLPFV